MEKIYIFTHSVSRKNGGSSSILDLSNCMSELGYDVKVNTVLGSFDKKLYRTTNVNKELDIVPISNVLVDIKKVGKPKYFVNKIISFISKFGNIKSNSIVIDSFGLPDDYKQYLRTIGCKVVLNHAGSVKAYSQYFMGSNQNQNQLNAYLTHIKTYDRVLFQSPSQAEELDSLLGEGQERSILIRPSVSESDIKACQKHAKKLFKNNKTNITVVGSVQRRKGQDYLIDIAEILNESECDYVINVVGNVLEQDFYDQLLKTIKEKELSQKIIFHGFQSDYLSYMNDSDIILQVSKEEGVSRILREAMALGKAIVSFRLDGTADLLEEDFDCLLAEPEQVKDITKKLYEVINDEAQRLSLGENARLNFDKKYSYVSYSKQVNEFVKSMLGK
ncbi:TPA: glycosyltransferase family 4 protein [Vibrio diabolicus]|uniref:glycosyltransferase family 4 protein n=1 Tax=Vibrio diabolicus TaxID=50719 RepID=UPI0040689EF7